MIIHQCDRCGKQDKTADSLKTVRVPDVVYFVGPKVMGHIEPKHPEMDLCDTCIMDFACMVELWIKNPCFNVSKP